MNINKSITELLKFTIETTLKDQKKNIQNDLSAYNYFVSWSETIGYSRLKLFLNPKRNFFFYIKTLIKTFISCLLVKEKVILYNKNIDYSEYKKVVISWCSKNQFDNNGNYLDRYFNIRAKEKTNYLWILISIDNYIPGILENNIQIITNSKNYFIYAFLKNVKFNMFSLKKILHYSSPLSISAILISKIITKQYNHFKFDTIITPYEAQPFQNFLFTNLKKINPKIKNIGYYCGLPALPLNMIYKKGAPDFIYVSSLSQKNHLARHLLWPKNSIKFIPSLRLIKEENNFQNSQIFLPYSVYKSEKILLAFHQFFNQFKINSLNHFKIRNHPLMKNSPSHNKLIKKLKKIINNNSAKFSKEKSKKNICIFIGTSTALIDALSRDIIVYQICNDPVMESFSELMWPSLKIEELSKNLFFYQKKDKIFELGEKKSISYNFDKMIN